MTSLDIAEEERDNEAGKIVVAHGSVARTCETTQIGLADESKEYCNAGKRWTETCVAPRHIDASRDALQVICSFSYLSLLYAPYFLFVFISSIREAWGGGGCQTFPSCSLFPVQLTTSGIGHRVK